MVNVGAADLLNLKILFSLKGDVENEAPFG